MKTKEPPYTEPYVRWCGRSVDKIIIYLLPDCQNVPATNLYPPTGNLDSKTSEDVMALLKMTSEKFNQTIILITHNNEIAALADRRITIRDGKIIA